MNERMAQDEILIERVFDAPIEMIWQFWTQPEHFKRWYAPEGFSVPVAEMDVRVGGKRLICMEMQTPAGSRKMWTAGVYREVSPYTRLVFTESMSDEQGNITAAGMEETSQPMTTEVTVSLEAVGERTKMVMTHAGMPQGGEGAREGWQQAFNKLSVYIEQTKAG